MNTTSARLAEGERPLGSPEGGYGIVAFSHLRWGFVWQRPQQFLSRFAKNHPVLFIEEAEYGLDRCAPPLIHMEDPFPGVTVARFILPRDLGRGPEFESVAGELTGQIIDALNIDGRFDRPLLWFYNPMDAPWAIGPFPHRGVVYDCMDELSQFRFAPANLARNERMLMDCADIVFTGGYELWLRKSKEHPNAHFFGCGVEYDHFAKAQSEQTPIPEDVKELPHPILGWFGVVDERMDYDLLAAAAHENPNWSFLMVGPVVKVDPDALPKLPNIHWMGQRSYGELPGYCKAFDLCMMNFALNESTEYINPTKALEYLATGKPVISTPIKDVIRQYKDYVYIADGEREFSRMAKKALDEPDMARIRSGIEKARQSGWDQVVARMSELIEASLGAATKVSLR